MAVRQLNTANFDYAMMLPLIIKAYKSNATITISEYDTDVSPDVKVGSIFEVNGALFIVESADITPTGYTGVSNSTTFYLYWDVDPGAFIYSSSAPTWSDAKQGWYNSNDRAFFSMFKDSGGTLYGNKIKLSDDSGISIRTKIIEIGNWDMVAESSVNVSHGIVDFTKIRNISVLIRADVSGNLYNFMRISFVSGIIDKRLYADSTDIIIIRDDDGGFDSTTFDATPYNRGWITIMYEV